MLGISISQERRAEQSGISELREANRTGGCVEAAHFTPGATVLSVFTTSSARVFPFVAHAAASVQQPLSSGATTFVSGGHSGSSGRRGHSGAKSKTRSDRGSTSSTVSYAAVNPPSATNSHLLLASIVVALVLATLLALLAPQALRQRAQRRAIARYFQTGPAAAATHAAHEDRAIAPAAPPVQATPVPAQTTPDPAPAAQPQPQPQAQAPSPPALPKAPPRPAQIQAAASHPAAHASRRPYALMTLASLGGLLSMLARRRRALRRHRNSRRH